jgi:hypothetical protein
VSVEAWVSLIVMALFNVLSTAFYIGVNKQMLNEVMRRVSAMETEKVEKEVLSMHVRRFEEEQQRTDRELQGVRMLLERRMRDQP